MAAPAPGLQKVDFKNLKPQETAMLVISILVALGFGWHKFDYVKLEGKRVQTAKKLSDVEAINASFKQAIVSPEKIKQTEEEIVKVGQEMEVIRAEIGDIKDKMSAKSASILQQLKKEAGRKGSVLRSFKTSEKKINKGKFTYREISITMKIQSEYDTIMNLIQKFERVPEFLSLKGLETERVEEILPLVETLLRFDLVIF